MRRALVTALLTLGLIVPAVALAGDSAGDDGTLSVRSGKGLVGLNLSRGATIGRLGKGRLTVDDWVDTDNTRIDFWGCELTRDIDENTTVCAGTYIRFRIIGNRYRLKLTGRGIFLSAVGQGTVTLNGSGDPDLGIYRDGVYSLNGDPYRSLPDDSETFQLAPSLDTVRPPVTR
jgi:hypothetical protein